VLCRGEGGQAQEGRHRHTQLLKLLLLLLLLLLARLDGIREQAGRRSTMHTCGWQVHKRHLAVLILEGLVPHCSNQWGK
jgi:hypothetical protein